jgi:hypothetical protein
MHDMLETVDAPLNTPGDDGPRAGEARAGDVNQSLR